MATTPWLILGRVVLVSGGAEAEEEQPAEADARAEYVVEVDAEEQAHAEHAAAAAEADFTLSGAVPPRVSFLPAGRGTHLDEHPKEEEPTEAEARAEYLVEVDAEEQAHAEHAAAAAEPDFTISVAIPPRLTFLAGRGTHPDEHPYIIAASPLCLLIHFTGLPSSGELPTDTGYLALARYFQRADGQIAASAERVPCRTDGAVDFDSVALVPDERGGYMIVELQVQADKGGDHRATFFLRSAGHGWTVRHMACPLPAEEDRKWVPHGAVAIGSTACWFDLSWGILSCDFSLREPYLIFQSLPDARRLDEETLRDIHTRRCVTVSRSRLRYVEIIPEGEAATVLMWTRMIGPDGWKWYMKYAVSFEKIWNDDSYRSTQLPRNVPSLAVVCPSDPDLIYFELEHHLFGVNVPGRVVRIKPSPCSASSPSIIAWEVPPAVAQVENIEGGELGRASKTTDKKASITTPQGLQERGAASSSARAGRLAQDISFGTVPDALLIPDEAVKATIVDVWNENMDHAFDQLRVAIQSGSNWLVGMDTEFCMLDGVIVPRVEPKTEEGNYQQACRIVDEGDLVQVGLVPSDADLNVFSDQIFQFNIRFDSSGRNPGSGNVEYLRTVAKVKLAEHASRGIPIHNFFGRFIDSGILCNTNITWITFQGYSDFGYLIRGIEEIAGLPPDRREYLGLINKYFPRSYDLKIFHQLGICCIEPSGEKGSRKLESMASGLGVLRVGDAHGAGSDAHLTLACYHQMLLSDPLAATNLSHYRNIVYGVAPSIPSPPGAALDPIEIHLWASNFDSQMNLFTKLFRGYVAVGVEVRFENSFNSQLPASYGAVRREHALSGLVQMGLAVSDFGGNIGWGRIWVFHMQGSDDLLENHIRPARLAQMLTSTGAVLNRDITWSSSGSAACLYMVTVLTRSGCLPLKLEGFKALSYSFFPNLRLLGVRSWENSPAIRALATVRQLVAVSHAGLPEFYDLTE